MSLFSWISVETIVLLLTVLFLIRFYIHRKWQVLKKQNIPHNPPSIRKLGNLLENIKNPNAIFTAQIENKKKFGRICGAYDGLHPRVTIYDPDVLKQIFIKEFSSFSRRSNNFRRINGKELNLGVNIISGEHWKRVRNTLSPSFSSSKMKEMFGIIDGCIDATLNRLSKILKEKDEQFEAKEVFSRLSLDVICSAAFSTKVNAQTNDGKPPQIIEKAQKAFDFSVFGRPWFLLVILFPSIERLLELFKFSIFSKETILYFSSLVDRLIQTHSSQTEKQRTDLMQLMLQARISDKDVKNGISKGLTATEIVGNSMILMLAGFDTTANAMIFLAYNLATHQDVQKKLIQELDDALEDHGKLTFDVVNKMKYLEMCINESLRLYGIVPINSRFCDKDVTIGDITISKGTRVIAPVYALSHDEEYWDKPYEFNPERMEDMSKIDPIIFQPFGAGPRNCIGMRFAMMEIKLAFCKILQRFSLDVTDDTPEPPLDVVFKASVQPKKSFHLKIKQRSSD